MTVGTVVVGSIGPTTVVELGGAVVVEGRAGRVVVDDVAPPEGAGATATGAPTDVVVEAPAPVVVVDPATLEEPGDTAA